MKMRITLRYQFVCLLLYMVTSITCRLHPSNAHRRFHRKKTSLSAASLSRNILQTSTELLPTTSTQLLETKELSPSTTITTTQGITFEVGNYTINNLENTLDDIAPGEQHNGSSTEETGYSATNPFSDTPMFEGTITENPKTNSTANVILEVINIAPYFKGRSKYSKKFALIVLLYGTLAVSCMVLGVLLFRGITRRNKRHRQYMLLTKRDLEFPLGGGGI